jgi:hypothetical protein
MSRSTTDSTKGPGAVAAEIETVTIVVIIACITGDYGRLIMISDLRWSLESRLGGLRYSVLKENYIDNGNQYL